MIAAVAMMTTSCAPIREELYYPNGYTGYELDRHSVNVSASKQFQLVRAAIVLAMASRMATATVHDGRDADAVADYLAAASDELNYSAADLYAVDTPPGVPCSNPKDLGDKTKPCTGYVQNFESDLPMLEGRIINVMIAALPQERSRQFLSDVRKGDVLGASLAALRTVFQSVVGLDRSAGVYRSGLELLASSINCQDFEAKTSTVGNAAQCLGIPQTNAGHFPEPLKFNSPDENAKYALTALMVIAQTSCVRMPLSSDEAIADAVSHRNDSCGKVTFEPKQRPSELKTTDPIKQDAPGKAAAGKPAAANAAADAAKKAKAGD